MVSSATRVQYRMTAPGQVGHSDLLDAARLSSASEWINTPQHPIRPWWDSVQFPSHWLNQIKSTSVLFLFSQCSAPTRILSCSALRRSVSNLFGPTSATSSRLLSESVPYIGRNHSLPKIVCATFPLGPDAACTSRVSSRDQLRIHWPAHSSPTPRMRFLSVRSAVCLRFPSDSASQRTPSPFG